MLLCSRSRTRNVIVAVGVNGNVGAPVMVAAGVNGNVILSVGLPVDSRWDGKNDDQICGRHGRGEKRSAVRARQESSRRSITSTGAFPLTPAATLTGASTSTITSTGALVLPGIVEGPGQR